MCIQYIIHSCVCVFAYIRTNPNLDARAVPEKWRRIFLEFVLSGKKGTKLRCCNQVLFDSVQCKQLQTIANSKILANLFLDRETGALQIEKRHLIELNSNICHCHKLDQRPLLLAEPICILLWWDSWCQDSYWLEQYSWALFKAMSHMLCIGYGRSEFHSQSSKGLAGDQVYLLIRTPLKY